jgi:hypothetical protein
VSVLVSVLIFKRVSSAAVHSGGPSRPAGWRWWSLPEAGARCPRTPRPTYHACGAPSTPCSEAMVNRLGYFFGSFHYRPGSTAHPPKNYGRGPRGPRAHTTSTHPELVQPPRPSALASRRHAGRRNPRRRRTWHPSYLRRSLEQQTPLACDLQLASAAVSAARLDSFGLSPPWDPPRQSALQPTKEDLRLRPPDSVNFIIARA